MVQPQMDADKGRFAQILQPRMDADECRFARMDAATVDERGGVPMAGGGVENWLFLAREADIFCFLADERRSLSVHRVVF